MKLINAAKELLCLAIMVAVLFLLLAATIEIASADTPTYRIAIIDDGYNPILAESVGATPLKLCNKGHYNVISKEEKVTASGQHGTVVGSLVAQALKDVSYCAVIVNIFDPDYGRNRKTDISNAALALEHVAKININLVNMSFEGKIADFMEQHALEQLSQRGVTMFAAAGNSSFDLDRACNSYPACYEIPALYSVGALDEHGLPASYSNYGSKVDLWYFGIYTLNGNVFYGTSFASPRALSDYVLSRERRRKK